MIISVKLLFSCFVGIFSESVFFCSCVSLMKDVLTMMENTNLKISSSLSKETNCLL